MLSCSEDSKESIITVCRSVCVCVFVCVCVCVSEGVSRECVCTCVTEIRDYLQSFSVLRTKPGGSEDHVDSSNYIPLQSSTGLWMLSLLDSALGGLYQLRTGGGGWTTPLCLNGSAQKRLTSQSTFPFPSRRQYVIRCNGVCVCVCL